MGSVSIATGAAFAGGGHSLRAEDIPEHLRVSASVARAEPHSLRIFGEVVRCFCRHPSAHVGGALPAEVEYAPGG